MLDRPTRPAPLAALCSHLATVAADAHCQSVAAAQTGFRRLASGFQSDARYFARRALECRLELLGIDLED